jgi:enterochelin esterase-like enzyme
MMNLYQLARANGNPVIAGNHVTFVWKGKSAPRFMDDSHGWDANPQTLTRIAPDLWAYSCELDSAAYIEYAFLDAHTKKRLKDPFNKNIVENGFGASNHFFYMPEAAPTPYAVKRRGIPSGRMTRHLVDTAWMQEDGRRSLYLYQPPVKTPVPLLLIYDGGDYLKRVRLNVMVDNLIHEKRIRPIALAFWENGGSHRNVEYLCSDATLLTLNDVILPFASKRLNLLDLRKHHGAYGVLGASASGLMSMYTGLRMPDVFGNVICQSGVFGLHGRDFAVVDLVRARQARTLNIWMEIGLYDFLLDDNRRMQPLLQRNGYNVTYHESASGHNYTSWRDELPRALEALFGS